MKKEIIVKAILKKDPVTNKMKIVDIHFPYEQLRQMIDMAIITNKATT